jgi:NTE family protein
MKNSKATARPKTYDKKVGLVLQGGGALGSYQAGVYEALADSPYEPDWVAGISIGAINAALIAGNAPKDRVARLKSFWEEVTAPTAWWPQPPGGRFVEAHRQSSSLATMLFGQPGFFKPNISSAWMTGVSPTSFYSTSDLKSTLEKLVDFDRINAQETRFSVGAVNVRNSRLVYFDNAEIKIRPKHIMASGALPPGFPAVEIDGELYWDGGLVSNTPLQYVLEYVPRRSRLTFQVDLFHAYGNIPSSMEEVNERDKDIRYSSRTRVATEMFRRQHDVRHNINTLWDALQDELRERPEAQFLYNFGCVTTMDIVQLIYRPMDSQGATKDFEFSRSTMQARWDQGVADTNVTLEASPWLAPMPPEVGARTFDVVHDILVGKKGQK